MSDDARDTDGDQALVGWRWQCALGVALVVALCFVTLPGLYMPLGPAGIDPGWQWAVNHAREAKWIFGRDIVFTYGPLGFLMAPMDVSSNLLVANGFLIATQLLFGIALATVFLRERRLQPLLAFALLFVCARHQGLATEAFLVLVVGLLTVTAVAYGHRPAGAAAAALAAVLLLVKMSLGVAALAILGTGIIVGRLLYRRTAAWAIGLLAYPLVVGGLAVALFDSPCSFVNWLRLSFEVVSDYSVANSILGPPIEVAVGLVLMGLWLGAAVVVGRERLLLACNLLFAPLVLIQFRLAFVRQDTHQLQFIPFMVALISISVLLSRRPRQVVVHGLIFAGVLAVGAVSGLVDPMTRGLLPGNLWRGGSGPASIARLIGLDSTRAELAASSARNLEPLRLPEDWVAELERSRNGVGTLPWEIQFIPANGLRWNPTPTLQLYSAYTRHLDVWSAERYAGDAAPEYILNQFAAVGKRRQLFDAPATWRTVFMNYTLRSVASGREPILLLQRRKEERRWSLEEIGRESGSIEGAGFAVPGSPHFVFAHFRLGLNALGRFQKTAFRVPLIFAMMTHASGRSTACRLIPGTAGNGVLINGFPGDLPAYVDLWGGRIRDPVIRCTITGPGTVFFRDDVDVTWSELRFAAPSAPFPSAPRQDSAGGTSPGPRESR